MTAPHPNQLRRTLVGEFSGERAVVLTPIMAMFRRFQAHGWVGAATAGWWPRVHHRDVHVVLIPQGSALRDLAPSLLRTPAVELVGYAGSRSAEVSVATIARPVAACLAGGSERWHLSAGTEGAIASVPNLLAGYALDGNPDVTLTDMESGHLAHALAGSPVLIGVRVLVTDRWPDEPFHRQTPERRTALVHQRDVVVDQLVEERWCR